MQEWETAQTAYKRAEADGTVSRYNDGDDGLMMMVMMMGLSAGIMMMPIFMQFWALCKRLYHASAGTTLSQNSSIDLICSSIGIPILA